MSKLIGFVSIFALAAYGNGLNASADLAADTDAAIPHIQAQRASTTSLTTAQQYLREARVQCERSKAAYKSAKRRASAAQAEEKRCTFPNTVNAKDAAHETAVQCVALVNGQIINILPAIQKVKTHAEAAQEFIMLIPEKTRCKKTKNAIQKIIKGLDSAKNRIDAAREISVWIELLTSTKDRARSPIRQAAKIISDARYMAQSYAYSGSEYALPSLSERENYYLQDVYLNIQDVSIKIRKSLLLPIELLDQETERALLSLISKYNTEEERSALKTETRAAALAANSAYRDLFQDLQQFREAEVREARREAQAAELREGDAL